MFGRRVGMGTKTGVSLAAALLMAFGLTTVGSKKPPKPKTPMEVATGLIVEGNELCAEGELDAAEKKVNEAKEKCPTVEGVQELLDKIAAKREVIAKEAETAKVRADAKAAYDAGNFTRAIEIASKMPDCPVCKQIIADAKMKLQVGGKEAQKAKYTAQNAKINAAIAAGRFSQAISGIRTLEALSGPGLPSRLPEIPKIQSKDKLAQAKRASGRRALELAEQALRLDPQNSEAKTLVARLKKGIADAAGKGALRQRYNSNLRRMRSMVSRDPRGALRLYDELRKQARELRISTREVDDLAKKAREQSEYQTAYDQAKRYLQTGELARAKSSAQEARRKKYTRPVVELLKTIDGQIAVKEGDAAAAASKWDEAVLAYGRADAAGVPVADKLANAKAKVDEAKVGGFLADADAKGKGLQWAQVDTPRVKALADAGNVEAKKLMKRYPLKAEAKKIDAAALKPYKALLAKLKKIAKTKHSLRIETIKEAMPDFSASKKYTGSAEKLVNKENDALFKGRYTQFTVALKKIKSLSGQIDYIQQQAPVFAETSYKAKIAKTLTSTKTKKAGVAFKKQSTLIKAAKDKIAAIESAQQIPDFKGTKYEKTLSGMLTSEKNKRATGASKKVVAEVKKLAGIKNADRRIARYEQALTNPIFADTKFVETFKKSIKKERDAKAKAPFAKLTAKTKKMKPAEKIIALTAALGEAVYSGTSFIDKMNGDIKKTKEGLLKGKFAALKKRVAGMRSPQLRIVAWEGARPTYGGTKFEETIKGSIQKEKDGILGAAYKKLVIDLKKLPPLRQIDRLKTAQAEFAASKKYKASVDKLLKKKEAGLEKDIYGAISAEVKKAKRAADKVRILERRKGDLKTDVYRKKIDAEIKKLNAQITKAAQAAKDKQLTGAYKTLMTKVGNKKLKSAAKVTILETEQGRFVGSGFAKKITDQIAKFKKAIAGEAAAAKEAAAKKAYDAVVKKLVKAKKPADCDANIAKLEDLKFQLGKTSYAKKVDGLIAKERATKKKLTPKPR